ncbi:MAG TPA: type 1 glutamine amidotransferase domain-containing protein [Bdellovibrionales bacterium]|nr:type 1 glutamine amidotransferase domain-containing protein [Bdellovibrionales bacterium]
MKKEILMVVANPSVSKMTGWPIGFWWSELTHPYWEFVQRGHNVTIVSPKGGDLEADSYSDPEHESGYSAHDFLSLGFKKSKEHAALLKDTKSISDANPKDYDAIFVIGGQSPMYTMADDRDLHKLFAKFYESKKVAAVVCHGTVILLKTKTSDGKLLVKGKRWTGFSSAEEDIANKAVGQRIQPFRIEDEAKKIRDTSFVVALPFSSFAVADGNLITGQQQYSGAETARLVLKKLGEII